MENQEMSCSTSSAPKPMSCPSSSAPKPEKLKSLVVAVVEESKETATRNNDLIKLGSPQEVTERRVENPSLGSAGPVPRVSEILKRYPPKSNKIYTCLTCKKGFPTGHALGGHQNAHREEKERDKKRKVMEGDSPGLAFVNPNQDKPRILLGGYYPLDALSIENHLGITLEPFKRRLVYPSFNTGVTGGISDMNMAVVPGMTRTSFFTENTSASGFASDGLGLFPSNNNMYPFIPSTILLFPLTPTSSDFIPQENVVVKEEIFSEILMSNVVEIIDDDDAEDQPEEWEYKSGGIDLSLSL